MSLDVDELVSAHLATSPDTQIDELVEIVRQRFPLRDVVALTDAVEQCVARGRGLGRISELLARPGVTEIMINGDGSIWIDAGAVVERAELRLTSGDLVVLVERILQPLGLRVDPLSPSVDARLSDGSRVNIVVPPVAVDGPTITIRRFAAETLPLEAFGPPEVVALLESLVDTGATMLVVGGTGAGKTTLLNALASSIPDGQRIVTIEDTAELDLPGEHVVRLEARPANREGLGEVTIRDLVRNALRMRPDRLIVGEVRSGEAFDLLLALNTGHGGSLATCHANGPLEGLQRLETLAMLAGADVPLAAIRQQMLSAIDVVVHVVRNGSERRVAAIERVDSALLGTERLWPVAETDRGELTEVGAQQGQPT